MFFILYCVSIYVLGSFIWRTVTAPDNNDGASKFLLLVVVTLIISLYTLFAATTWNTLRHQPSVKQYYQSISKQLPSFTGTVECEGLNPVLKGTQRSSVYYNNNLYLVSYKIRYDHLTGLKADSSWYGLCPLGLVPTVNTVVGETSNITARIAATAEYILKKESFIAAIPSEHRLIADNLAEAIKHMEQTGQQSLSTSNGLQVVIDNVVPKIPKMSHSKYNRP